MIGASRATLSMLPKTAQCHDNAVMHLTPLNAARGNDDHPALRWIKRSFEFKRIAVARVERAFSA
jgi:hypothetical protein